MPEVTAPEVTAPGVAAPKIGGFYEARRKRAAMPLREIMRPEGRVMVSGFCDEGAGVAGWVIAVLAGAVVVAAVVGVVVCAVVMGATRGFVSHGAAQAGGRFQSRRAMPCRCGLAP
jgi:hypothetical protein